MPMLKYKDPADGLWKPVPVGAGSVNEVTVAPGQPTDGSELWLDTDEPAVNGGLGWADGLPRFPSHAARDAAYAAIGGPVEGMTCWVLQTGVLNTMYTYITARWQPIGGTMPSGNVQWAGTTFGGGMTRLNYAPSSSAMLGGLAVDGAGAVTVADPGRYLVTLELQYKINGGADYLAWSWIGTTTASQVRGSSLYGLRDQQHTSVASVVLFKAAGDTIAPYVEATASGSITRCIMTVQYLSTA